MTEEVATNSSNINSNNDNDNDDDNYNYDFLSKEERKKKVIELYFVKRMPMHKIAKKLRMSLTTVVDTIKGHKEAATTATTTKERAEVSVYDVSDDDGNGNGNGKGEQRQYHQIIPTSSASSSFLPSLSATELEKLTDKQKAVLAYKLYDQGISPVQVATTLCLTAKETMTYQREFLRLKGCHKLHQIYPEIEQSLPTLLTLFIELKRQGLTMQNVKWFVDGLKLGSITIEDMYTDSLNQKAENQKLKDEYGNLRYENQSLRNENQDIVDKIQYNRRIFENESKAMQQDIANLIFTRGEMQKSVDKLGSYMGELLNKKASLEEFVYRFRSTNQKYYRIKGTAKEVVSRFWSQALREPDKKMVFTIILSSMIEALRENPDQYNIIFGGSNNGNNNNIYQQQDAVLEVSNRLSKALIERLVNDTMSTLESNTESEAEAEDTESTDVVAKANNIEAATPEEEETKPEEDKEL